MQPAATPSRRSCRATLCRGRDRPAHGMPRNRSRRGIHREEPTLFGWIARGCCRRPWRQRPRLEQRAAGRQHVRSLRAWPRCPRVLDTVPATDWMVLASKSRLNHGRRRCGFYLSDGAWGGLFDAIKNVVVSRVVARSMHLGKNSSPR